MRLQRSYRLTRTSDPMGQSARRQPPQGATLLLLLAALSGLIVWPHLRLSAPHDGAKDSVVTVTEVERALAQNPARWNGQIVQVRGRAARWVSWQPPDELVAQVALVDAAPDPGAAPLVLTWGRPDPLLATLRRLPLLRGLVPPPQHLRGGTTAVYRVQLWATRGGASGSGAVLLDAEAGR